MCKIKIFGCILIKLKLQMLKKDGKSRSADGAIWIRTCECNLKNIIIFNYII